MILIKDLFEKYGDIPLNQEVIELFGLVEPKRMDCGLRIKDIETILNIKNGSIIIRRLKSKYNLNYKEAIIPASILAKEYGMKTEEIMNYLHDHQL